MRIAGLDEVRAAIASFVLGNAPGARALGSVVLHAHQCQAVARLTTIMRARGGALLADEVGLGKTFTALALAAEFGRPTVIGPAALRAMWRTAAERAEVPIRFMSMESLGHGATIPATDFVIVDEAHHFRNPRTRRYAHLASGCARSSVLLMTATPVQNRLGDLRSITALILGNEALALSSNELSALVVRRSGRGIGTAGIHLPSVAEPRWVHTAGDADCLDQLCELPPALPLADGGHAHALVTFSLARQWASSRAALRSALTRRLATCRAMEDAIASGRHLTRADLGAWRAVDDAQQLAFPELIAAIGPVTPEMAEQVRAHADALRSVLAWLKYAPDVDQERATALLAIAERHPGERIVAFSEFTATIAELYRRLAPHKRAAMLTHAGGRVAGGAIGRRDVLAQFAGAHISEHARIDLLLTTDVLSEGVDLQGASVLVHLDLAWNPGRMEQRVGRLRRFGAARDSIAVYLFAPPAPTERLLALDRRLREKLGDAARAIGHAGGILPDFTPGEESTVGRRERVAAILESWLGSSLQDEGAAAGVACGLRGAIACVRAAGVVRLVMLRDDRVEDDVTPETLQAVSDGQPADVSSTDVDECLRRFEQWLRRRDLTDVVELPVANVACSRRAILTRVNGIARRWRRHQRSSLHEMLGAARRAATVSMPAGAERVLGELAQSQLPDEAWLRAIGEFSAIHGRAETQPDAVLALLLLVPK